MKPSHRFALALALAALPANRTLAVLAYGTPNTTVSQNFDSLATSGTGLTWTNASTLGAGWYLFDRNNNAITSYRADVSSTGSFYSFGSASDRALGGVGSSSTYFGGNPGPGSGSEAGYIAFAMTNTTGVPLDSFTVGFRGEQWYRNSNANPQLMAFQYGFGNAFGTVPSWTPLGGSFDYFSPVVGSSAASVDGNVAGLVAGRGGTVNVPIASGATLWLRWIERNDSGNDHGLAIDDFSFVGNLAAIPEPTAPLLAALLAATLATTVARRPLQRRVAGVAA